jgi:hypothetical protein
MSRESFRRRYEITESEVKELTNKLADIYKDEVFINAKHKAEYVIDEILSKSLDKRDTVTTTWNIETSVHTFIIWLGEIRRKASGKK